MRTIIYHPKGVCSRQIKIIVSDDNIVEEVEFTGGCSGNAAGISKLVAGMKVSDVISKLKGTVCGHKSTSCPDQLARALEQK